MANAWHPSSGTWVIDTAAGTVIDSRQLRLDSITWSGPDTVGHQVVITDALGGRIWSSTAGTAEQSDGKYFGDQFYRGLIVPTLGSGVLEIVTR